ncbi:hypothetical protein VTK73DRAFT_8185 [Phialemonium thermophilum]|uniref:Uncharacterized protein n=1 Tax=Phialemonium thermophilum TaxID=223376 RepID=A0ABR3XPZ2_9PEZI
MNGKAKGTFYSQQPQNLKYKELRQKALGQLVFGVNGHPFGGGYVGECFPRQRDDGHLTPTSVIQSRLPPTSSATLNGFFCFVPHVPLLISWGLFSATSNHVVE